MANRIFARSSILNVVPSSVVEESISDVIGSKPTKVHGVAAVGLICVP